MQRGAGGRLADGPAELCHHQTPKGCHRGAHRQEGCRNHDLGDLFHSWVLQALGQAALVVPSTLYLPAVNQQAPGQTALGFQLLPSAAAPAVLRAGPAPAANRPGRGALPTRSPSARRGRQLDLSPQRGSPATTSRRGRSDHDQGERRLGQRERRFAGRCDRTAIARQEGAKGLALPMVVPSRCRGGSYLRADPTADLASAAAAIGGRAGPRGPGWGRGGGPAGLHPAPDGRGLQQVGSKTPRAPPCPPVLGW